MKAAMAIGLFFPALLWASAAMADCKCMANGRVFHHGEIACLRLPSGPQLAQCGMVLNNSSWIKLQDGCPVAEAQFEGPDAAHRSSPGSGQGTGFFPRDSRQSY
jgi:hypothetical protein